ncbi:hypothetical protein [Microbulbifer sp. YPW1]|uniref:hypothetical protein n=1 Tax=Microbulbifer sp. YPW1 TaxID=2745199 RepID=UPI00159B1FD8|nr:hypothetical protein [Microbulbifer sp. YPW1]QKX17409.1 hypothetical protein HUW35_10615 [Microbulbifer sp. YPW1]
MDGELLDALLGALLEALAEALLVELALLLEEELLDDELLDDELLDEEALAVFSSSEKSISSGGSPWLLDDGSGGIRESSGRWSESLYTGVDGLPLALGSCALLLDERERRSDSEPLLDAVEACWLERSPDSILGMEVFG